MIYISLDEQGDFEGQKKDVKDVKEQPVFIGGFIFDDKGEPEELEKERVRLEGYLRNVCASVKCSYPQDLHCSNKKGVNNSEFVRKVKKQLTKTMKQFLQEGTFGKKVLYPEERKGSYHLFAILKSHEGKQELLDSQISDLVKDDFASNLYVHMAEDVVERLVFHNPVIQKIEKVQFELATRLAVINGGENNPKVEEYTRFGYAKNQFSTEQTQKFGLTNTSIYRTAVEREMIATGKNNIQVESLAVKNIEYNNPTNTMPFLYLADVICSVLGNADIESDYPKKWKGTPKEWIEAFYKRMTDYTGHSDNLLFSYDSADTGFANAWKKLEEADYYEALSIAYDTEHMDSEMTDFYKRVWFPKLREQISKTQNYSAYREALRKLRESTRVNNLNQEKLLVLFEELCQMEAMLLAKGSNAKEVLYDLYDTGVTVYCHIGDSAKSFKYFTKCKEYAPYTGTEQYLATRNRMVVFLCDVCWYEDAQKIAEENVEYQEQLQQLRTKIFGAKSEGIFTEYGKAISQLGQVYAYQQNDAAETTFLKSLELYEEGTPDYLITQSYLLHFYIDANKKEQYDACARKYFGNNVGLEKQLKYILNTCKAENPNISLKFALYVYVKALYKFHLDDITDKLLKHLLNIEETLNGYGEQVLHQLNGHPWEIIYKYLAMIAYKKGQQKVAEAYMKKTDTCLRYGDSPILEWIREYGHTEYNILTGKNDDGAKLSEKITYMYR